MDWLWVIVECAVLLAFVLYLSWRALWRRVDTLPGDSQVVHGTPEHPL